LQKFRV